MADWFEVDTTLMSEKARSVYGVIFGLIPADMQDETRILEALLENADAEKIGRQVANQPIADCDGGLTCNCEIRRNRYLSCREYGEI